MKPILVIGGAGFIGSHIFRRGLEVTVKSYVEALKAGK